MKLAKKKKIKGDSQNEDQSVSLYRVVNDYIDKSVLKTKNTNRSWEYGYNQKYDLVVVSKNGRIGEIYEMEGLYIALPEEPSAPFSRSKKESDQYWERVEMPVDLLKIKSMAQWNLKPKEFKERWFNYIDREFDRREHGYWIMNNGVSTWIPPSHYMYLQ